MTNKKVCLLIGIVWIFLGFNMVIHSTPDAPPQTPEELHQMTVDGGAIMAEIHIKLLLIKNAHDPQSFAHVRTTYHESNNSIILTTHYRARNGFGSLRLGWIKIRADLEGNLIEVLAEG